MPTVAVIEGVKIQMFAQEHPPPHFHAVVAEHRAEIEIESLTLIKGSLPRAKLPIVISWAEPRRWALQLAWDRVTARLPPGKIK